MMGLRFLRAGDSRWQMGDGARGMLTYIEIGIKCNTGLASILQSWPYIDFHLHQGNTSIFHIFLCLSYLSPLSPIFRFSLFYISSLSLLSPLSLFIYFLSLNRGKSGHSDRCSNKVLKLVDVSQICSDRCKSSRRMPLAPARELERVISCKV